MSDLTPAAPAAPAPAAPAAPEPAAATAPAAPAPAPAAQPAAAGDPPIAPVAPAAPSFADLPAEYDRIEASPATDPATRAEIQKLRAEHKAYRERYGKFEQTYGQLPPEWQAEVDAFAAAVAAGDQATAAARARSWVPNQPAVPSGATPQAPADDPNRPLTVAEYQQMQHQQQLTARREATTTELRGYGYQFTEQGMPADDLATLAALHTVKGATAAEAHAKVEAWREEVATKFLADRAAAGAPMVAPLPSTPGGGQAPSGAPSTGNPQEDLRLQARARMKARLDAANAAQPAQ